MRSVSKAIKRRSNPDSNVTYLTQKYMINFQKLYHFENIYLGFSGGLDSRVLLELLCENKEISSKLTAIHVNHGISPNANEWEEWARKTCESLAVTFKAFSVILDNKKNLEESARIKRYDIFSQLLKSERDILVLAHHQNDQAETILLHLFRGAGIDGLSAMPEYRPLGKGQIYRPLLNISRESLESYALEKQLTWVEDESNTNYHFDRNFLRHDIIPQLQKRWPGVIGNLARSANHCSIARKQIRSSTETLLAGLLDEKQRLNISLLLSYSSETQMVLLRLWLEKQHFKKPDYDKMMRILNELIPATKDANPVIKWREGEVRRYQGWLYAFPTNADITLSQNFTPFFKENPNAKVEVRYRQGGEKIRLLGKTRDLKKLFQEWKIPPWERANIPLIYVNGILACVQGFAVSDDFSSLKWS